MTLKHKNADLECVSALISKLIRKTLKCKTNLSSFSDKFNYFMIHQIDAGHQNDYGLTEISYQCTIENSIVIISLKGLGLGEAGTFKIDLCNPDFAKEFNKNLRTVLIDATNRFKADVEHARNKIARVRYLLGIMKS